MCKRWGSRLRYFLLVLHSRRYRSRWRRPPRLREINAINGLQMKRLLYSGQHRDDCQERAVRLKGHLTHLLPAQREIKFAVSRPRFLFTARQHNRNDLFICRGAMINYKRFTIIWKGTRGRAVSRSVVTFVEAHIIALSGSLLSWNTMPSCCVVAQIARCFHRIRKVARDHLHDIPCESFFRARREPSYNSPSSNFAFESPANKRMSTKRDEFMAKQGYLSDLLTNNDD